MSNSEQNCLLLEEERRFLRPEVPLTLYFDPGILT
jgi:hypothetical protein